MNIFVQGSVAFDEINFFPGKFKDAIDVNYLDKLSVSFIVNKLGHFFGGCSGNICYSMGILGTPAYICSIVGEDGDIYIESLKKLGIKTDYLKKNPGFTAKANINSDCEGNQIVSFAPGVIGMDAEDFILPEIASEGDIMLIGPENHKRMLQSFEQAVAKKLKLFFDPGQLIHTFNKEEFQRILADCDGLFVNSYEWELLKNISEKSEAEIIAMVNLIFITDGEKGVTVYENGNLQQCPAHQIEKFEDPTGAGDAFRAGVLSGMFKGLDTFKAAKLGTIMGAACVEKKETQGHTITDRLKHEIESLGFSL